MMTTRQRWLKRSMSRSWRVRYLLVLHSAFYRQSLLGVTILILWGITTVAGAADKLTLNAVLELPDSDVYNTIPPQAAVNELTAVLRREAHRKPDELVQFRLERGKAHTVLGKFKEAQDDLDSVLSVEPSHRDARLHKAACLHHLGRTKEAEDVLHDLVRLYPSYVPAYCGLAAAALLREDAKTCIVYGSQALSLDPNNAMAYMMRGQGYAVTGALESALRDLSRAIELAPLFRGTHEPEHAYVLRGQVLSLLGEYELSIASLHMARRLNASSAPALYWMWLANDRLGRHHIACMLANQFVGLQQSDGLSLVTFATSLNRVGKHEEAIRACNRALESDADNADAFVQLGVAKHALKKPSEASKFLNDAFRRKWDDRECLSAMAFFLATCEDATYRDGPRAVELARRVCAKCNKDRGAHEVLATALAENKEYDEACKLMNMVLQAEREGSNKRRLERILGLFQRREPYRGQFERMRAGEKCDSD